ncbi:MAG: FkbM family methyltransferase [Candidatus Aureabacteria bacterium]|nr:FkbM family methyltransferase [Candidatus Auribacterota bacterium]
MSNSLFETIQQIKEPCFNGPYWTAEIYGFGKWIRDYGFFPRLLPLYIMTDHGPRFRNDDIQFELNFSAPVQFFHCQLSVEAWKKVSKKPCYVLFSPFVHYRQSRNIKQNQDAKGTLAYPAHSTLQINEETDTEKYIEELLKLPEEFQPIHAQFHYYDILRGRHYLWEKAGIKVHTAGHPDDYCFTERFYDILRRFKFTTSNLPMSCLYYSIEMGIPHFIYGPSPKYYNYGDDTVKLGEYDPVTYFSGIKQVYESFNGIRKDISQEQKKLVELGLGLKTGISRIHMALILYRIWIIETINKIFNSFKIFLDLARSRLNEPKEMAIARQYQKASRERQLGNLKSAEILFTSLLQKASLLSPELKSKYLGGACFHLGLIKLQNGQKEKATSYFKRALEFNPDHKKAKEYLADPDMIFPLSDPERLRIASLPRYQKDTVLFHNHFLTFLDGPSLLSGIKKIFEEKNYEFFTTNPTPVIIDAGANIGLSIIYFKKKFPNARIIAFEPNPDIYKVLSQNMKSFEFTNIEYHQKAVWKENGISQFDTEGGVSGRLIKYNDKKQLINVSTIRLADFLKEKIDFLKIDIEGARTEVIQDCYDNLHNVSYLFVEYHSYHKEKQSLHEILTLLHKAGFRYHVKELFTVPYPFLKRSLQDEMELQLNIFGLRK